MVGIAVVATAVTAYVAVSAAVNGVTSGYGTPPAFYIVAIVLTLIACAAALAEYRDSRGTTWLFGVGAIAGIIAWPYIAAGVVMGVGAILSLIEERTKASS